MTQQINLADPRLLPRGVSLGARHALWGVIAVFALGALASAGLHAAAARANAAARVAQAAAPAASAPATPPAADPSALAAEIERLRAAEADQRRVRAALDAGVAGSREGPSGYFVALARQARGPVWITGFAVADDGDAIDLEGRMAAPHALADYLRRLNDEPLFRGRPFAQLSLAAADGSAAQPMAYTEFALRSTPAPLKAR